MTASPTSPSPTAAAGSSSPDALGVVRNLPAGAARAALDPVVALAQAGLDFQDEPEPGVCLKASGSSLC